jgi:hypothetical protein
MASLAISWIQQYSNIQKALKLDVFDECSQPEYGGVHNMSCVPYLDSNISRCAKFGVVNSQFCRFSRFVTHKSQL